MHALNTQKFQMDTILSKQILFYSNKLWHKPSSKYTSNNFNQNLTKTINVITRKRPLIESSSRPKNRQFRCSNNKHNTYPTMNTSTSRPRLLTTSTQTEETDNTGKGRNPMQTELLPPVFPPATIKKKWQIIANTHPKAETTKQDRSLTPLLKMIRDKDWENLKKTNK